MSFWKEHAAREAKVAPPVKPVTPTAQNAPTECGCGHVGEDVILGICDDCFFLRESERE